MNNPYKCQVHKVQGYSTSVFKQKEFKRTQWQHWHQRGKPDINEALTLTKLYDKRIEHFQRKRSLAAGPLTRYSSNPIIEKKPSHQNWVWLEAVSQD